MTTSDQFLLAADLCHTVAQRFEREGKSNGGPIDREGNFCLMLAAGIDAPSHDDAGLMIVDLALDAVAEAADLRGQMQIPDWSDSSPTQVVIDCLRVAEKALLRKADADV